MRFWRISVDGRHKRIEMYAFSNGNVFVWTGTECGNSNVQKTFRGCVGALSSINPETTEIPMRNKKQRLCKNIFFGGGEGGGGWVETRCIKGDVQM